MISKLQKSDDIDKTAQLIYISASDLFDMIFGRKKAIISLSRLISGQGNMFGLDYVNVYKENDVIVGAIAGYSGKDKDRFRRFYFLELPKLYFFARCRSVKGRTCPELHIIPSDWLFVRIYYC